MISFQLNQNDDELIDLALKEDLGFPYADVTTQLLFKDLPGNQKRTVKMISKHNEPFVLCGLPIINALTKKLSGSYAIEPYYSDGEIIEPGTTILLLKGDTTGMLMLERSILNFVAHLSAVSTLTKRFVDKVQSSGLKILDTRKTTPGFRHLEKYAVFCGGGVNHRMGLYDALMIKDTHVDLVGGMEKVMTLLPEVQKHKYPVIVEVRDQQELKIVLEFGRKKITRILLDNMNPAELENCVRLCAGIIETEASGGINLNNIEQIAKTGVNYASVGMLTYEAGRVDLSIKGVLGTER
ncbi:MAG: carboxylating nicotinate-nucleotide diphosphorylase [Gammaproteobacteria bacterium]|nr:carboxylating nicotinate-nucleotide diphosphorylase [Gammaproteobacteria bacterium]